MVRRIEEETQAQQMQEKIKHQLEIIKMKTGSTDMKSQSVKNLVQDQLLLVLNNDATDPGKFKNFLPLVNQVIVYTGAVLPGIKASKQHKQVHELSEGMLVQTIAEAAGSPPTQSSLSDLEKYLPTSADMLDAMTKIGKVMGGNGGFNPIQMMTNIVSENDMKAAIDEVMHFPLRFPDLTESQLAVAEEVVLSVGLGFTNQEQAMETFLAAMNDEQRRMITSLQKNVIEKLLNAMMLPNGDPSPKLIEEIKREMREMEQKTGSTALMPEELKDLVKVSSQSNKQQSEELIRTQAMIAISADSLPTEFNRFLPLVHQAIVYSSVVLPGVKAKKTHKHNNELTESLLVQTMVDAAGARPSSTSSSTSSSSTKSEMAELEKLMPTAQDMLDAMVAVGNVVGGSSGFNPIQMVSNIVGQEKMVHIIDDIKEFPFRFPDLTDEQLQVAEEVTLSMGLGFMNQEQAMNKFLSSLNEEQKQMLIKMQKEVFEQLLDSMMTPDGQPTPALVEEIESQMREMQKRKGSTEMMPQAFKDLVAQDTKPQ